MPEPKRDRRLITAGAVVAAAIAALIAVAVVANLDGRAGQTRHRSSPPPSHQTKQASSTETSPRTASPSRLKATNVTVEHALLRQMKLSRATAASCRAPTAHERAKATIGGADSEFFSCTITLDGRPARFYVQVLTNGSFIAEPEQRPQQQTFGCCVARQTR